jgi:hypothetical protein
VTSVAAEAIVAVYGMVTRTKKNNSNREWEAWVCPKGEDDDGVFGEQRFRLLRREGRFVGASRGAGKPRDGGVPAHLSSGARQLLVSQDIGI